MKTKTKYITNDGSEFDSETAAKNHELLCTKVKVAIAPLGKIPERVSDGKGWIQHNKLNVDNTKLALLKLAEPLMKGHENLWTAYKASPLSIHPHSFMGRLLSDSDSPIYDGWQRLMCIDNQFREHQQPYFAINGPDYHHHTCIEDRS